MINQVYCTLDQQFSNIDNVDDISEIVALRHNLLWIDLENPSAEELQKIAEEFELHPLAVEDAVRMHQRPKIDEYTHFYFVVFYACQLNPDYSVKALELAMFMGENYLVTVHREPIQAIVEARRRWHSNTRAIESDIGVLLYSLLDAITDEYFPLIDSYEDHIEELETKIFNGKPRGTQRDYTSHILDLKRSLINLKRIIGPERDLLNVLTRRESPLFSERTRLYFQDVYDHLLRATEQLDSFRDMLNGAVEANMTMISNDMNKVMRTLTATSIILMSDALIAGIYGMNFQNMPELSWPAGYPLCIILMVFISVMIYTYFRRRDWF